MIKNIFLFLSFCIAQLAFAQLSKEQQVVSKYLNLIKQDKLDSAYLLLSTKSKQYVPFLEFKKSIKFGTLKKSTQIVSVTKVNEDVIKWPNQQYSVEIEFYSNNKKKSHFEYVNISSEKNSFKIIYTESLVQKLNNDASNQSYRNILQDLIPNTSIDYSIKIEQTLKSKNLKYREKLTICVGLYEKMTKQELESDLLIYYAEFLTKIDSFKKADEVYLKAIPLVINDSLIHTINNLRAYPLIKDNNEIKAIKILENELISYPNDYVTYFNLYTAYLSLGERNKARNSISNSIKVFKGDNTRLAELYYQAAILERDYFEYSKSLEYIDKSISLDKNNKSYSQFKEKLDY